MLHKATGSLTWENKRRTRRKAATKASASQKNWFMEMCFCVFGRTMSAISAMVSTKMAAMAQVFLAQRVRSSQTENDTSLLENLCVAPYT